jgi:hypothetical protein
LIGVSGLITTTAIRWLLPASALVAKVYMDRPRSVFLAERGEGQRPIHRQEQSIRQGAVTA